MSWKPDDGGGATDAFTNSLTSAKKLVVDAEHLENVGQYLDILSQAVRVDCQDALTRAHYFATVGGEVDKDQAASAKSALGVGFQEAEDLAKREQSTYTALHDSLAAVAKDLNRMCTAMKAISERYKTVEERNGLGVDAFLRALGGGV